MGENSRIEWTHHTFNPWIGCTKVSPGCAHCYAEHATFVRAQRKHGRELWGTGRERWRTSGETWRKPLVWNERARALGVRERVFCASLADWLDDEVPIEWLADLLALIEATQNLDWLLLTKRPELFPHRLHKVSRSSPFAARWHMLQQTPANVWVGTTVEDQQRAEERIPRLLAIPARVHFLSCEPLLGPVAIPRKWMELEPFTDLSGWRPRIDWLICGGESGNEARPMHPDWARDLLAQCQAAGVAFFFKQWGELSPNPNNERSMDLVVSDTGRAGVLGCDELRHDRGMKFPMYRIGKKKAGRLLDGREWNELPKIAGGGNS